MQGYYSGFFHGCLFRVIGLHRISEGFSGGSGALVFGSRFQVPYRILKGGGVQIGNFREALGSPI